MSETTPARATSNQSTEKAFAVLELLSEAQGPMRLRDISTALGLNSSTALRFVNALQNCGYAAQDPDTQRYYLTFKIAVWLTRCAATRSFCRLSGPLWKPSSRKSTRHCALQ